MNTANVFFSLLAMVVVILVIGGLDPRRPA